MLRERADPSDCCALSLQPFRNPVAVLADTKPGEPPRGDVFDLLNIVPYIRKFKTSKWRTAAVFAASPSARTSSPASMNGC